MTAATIALTNKVKPTKEQTGHLTVSLTLLAPFFAVALIALACSHVNLLAIAKMLPVCLLAFLGYAMMSLFNPRTEP